MDDDTIKNHIPAFKDIKSIKQVLKKDPLFIVCYSLSKVGHLHFSGYNTYDEAVIALKQHNNTLMWFYRDVRHLYADFDFDVPITNEQFAGLVASYPTDISNIINNNKSNQLQVNLTNKEFQYHTKRTDDGLVRSIHMVCLTHKMTALQQQELHRIYNKSKNDDEPVVDLSIYSSGQAFYSVGSGKIGGMLFEYDTINVYDYRTIWIDNPTSEAQLINFNIATLDEQLDSDDPPEVIKTNIISYLLDHKSIYLKRTRPWLDVLRYVKWSKCMTREDFCSESIVGKKKILENHVVNDIYQNNLDIWDAESNIYVTRDIHALFHRITQKYSVPEIFTEHFYKTINATAEERLTIAEYKVGKNGECNFGRVKFNTHSGMLIIDSKISYYYADLELEKQAVNADIYTTIKQHSSGIGFGDELAKLIADDTIKFKQCRAKWGVGKSYHIVKPIFEMAVKNRETLTAITQTNANNTQLVSNLRTKDVDGNEVVIATHQDKIFNSKYSVCSIESITKLKNKAPTYLILDEYVSLISQFNSTTMADKEYTSFCMLMDMIKSAKHVIILDADLTSKTYQHLIKTDDDTPMIYELQTNKFDDKVFNIYHNAKLFYENIYDDLLVRNLNVAVASNNKSISNNMRKKYVAAGIQVLTINADGMYINNERLSRAETKILQLELDRTIKNPDWNITASDDDIVHDEIEDIEECSSEEENDSPKKEHRQRPIQLFIYSPTITTGVSINDKNWFNTQYNIFNGYTTVNARTALQMTQRVRNISSNQHNILLGRMKKPLPDKTVEDMRAELTTDIAMMKQLGGTDLEQQKNSDFILSYLISRAENVNSQQQFPFVFYSLLKEHGLNVKIIHEPATKDESVIVGGDLLYEYCNMKYPTLEKIQSLTAKIVKRETLEYDEDILFGFLKIFMNGTFKHTTSNTLYNQPIKNSNKTRNVITSTPINYVFYGIFTHDELSGFMSRKRDYQISLQFHFMDKKHKNLPQLYHNCNKHTAQDYNPNFITNSTENISKLNYINTQNIVRIIQSFMKNLENEDGNIPSDKLILTEEIINHLNYIRPLRKSAPDQKVQSAEALTLSYILQINRTIMSNFGYEYNLTRNHKLYKKHTSPYILHSRPVHELPNIKIAYNDADKYLTKTSKKKSIHGVKLVNKYGAKNPAILKKLYDATSSLKDYTEHKEYVIKPNHQTQQLIRQNTTEIDYKADKLKTYGIQFMNGKCPTSKPFVVLTEHNPRDEKNVLTIYANVEKIKNVNADWIQTTRNRIATISSNIEATLSSIKLFKTTGVNDFKQVYTTEQLKTIQITKERLIRHLENIPRDVFKITNIFKHPIDRPYVPVNSILDELIASTTIFYERPFFPNMRTDYSKYPYNNSRDETPSYMDKHSKLPYDDISYKISWDNRPRMPIYAQ